MRGESGDCGVGKTRAQRDCGAWERFWSLSEQKEKPLNGFKWSRVQGESDQTEDFVTLPWLLEKE